MFFFYDFFKNKIFIYLIFAFVLLLSFVLLKQTKFEEDISGFLSEKGASYKNFSLLEKSGFLNKIVINLEADSKTSTNSLINSTNQVVKLLPKDLFTNIITGPNKAFNPNFLTWFLNRASLLLTQDDLMILEKASDKNNIRKNLKKNYDEYFGVDSFIASKLTPFDPIRLRTFMFKKLKSISLVPKINIVDNHFISQNGKNSLIIATTPIKITDSQGAKQLIQSLDKILKQLPKNIQAKYISAHRYTIYNANIVKKDIKIVFIISTLSLLIIFFVFFRNLSSIFIFFVPFISFIFAFLGLAIFYDKISLMVIGFGSVLLGITIDYAIHIFFTLNSEEGKKNTLKNIAPSILAGSFTTIFAFVVLLFSSLPIQKQLALFSISGLLSALFISFFIMPHFVQQKLGQKFYFLQLIENMGNKIRYNILLKKITLTIWFVILILCFVKLFQLKADYNLNSLNAGSEQYKTIEKHISKTWGDMKNKAFLFTSGLSFEKALEKNEEAYNFLKEHIEKDQIVTIAPILPSKKQMAENTKRWSDFWKQNEKKIKKEISSQCTDIGFSKKAFVPFFNNINATKNVLTKEDYYKFGFKDVFETMIMKDKDKFYILTLLPDTKENLELCSKKQDKNFHFISQKYFSYMLQKNIQEDFIKLVMGINIIIILFLLIIFRNLKKVLLILTPLASALVFMFGVMSFLGIKFNMFNIIATILLIGLGVDYGIFMLYKLESYNKHFTQYAIFISGLTTITSFGALVFAKHPAMHSIGLSVFLGLVIAVPTAIFILPILYDKLFSKKNTEF